MITERSNQQKSRSFLTPKSIQKSDPEPLGASKAPVSVGPGGPGRSRRLDAHIAGTVAVHLGIDTFTGPFGDSEVTHPLKMILDLTVNGIKFASLDKTGTIILHTAYEA